MRSRSKGGGNAFVAAAAAAAAALMLLLVPAQSRAVSFGANLSRVPNNTTTCNSLAWTYPSANPFTNCSFDSQDPATGETVFPPAGTGVVTKVRVRVGPDDRTDAGGGRAGPSQGQSG